MAGARLIPRPVRFSLLDTAAARFDRQSRHKTFVSNCLGAQSTYPALGERTLEAQLDPAALFRVGRKETDQPEVDSAL